jgi:hypothetical protein
MLSKSSTSRSLNFFELFIDASVGVCVVGVGVTSPLRFFVSSLLDDEFFRLHRDHSQLDHRDVVAALGDPDDLDDLDDFEDFDDPLSRSRSRSSLSSFLAASIATRAAVACSCAIIDAVPNGGISPLNVPPTGTPFSFTIPPVVGEKVLRLLSPYCTMDTITWSDNEKVSSEYNTISLAEEDDDDDTSAIPGVAGVLPVDIDNKGCDDEDNDDVDTAASTVGG